MNEYNSSADTASVPYPLPRSEELASLILLESKYQRFASEMSVLSIFDVSREKLKILKKIYKGENND